ncbi:MAG: FG-GAP repeat protein, partial [Thermoanaerobaculia bacterium]
SGTLRQEVGVLSVLYGSNGAAPNWFDLAKTDYFHQGILYGASTQQDYDQFGSALAAGDFNSDGRDDLAVGHPGEDVGAAGSDRGGVTILTGSAEMGVGQYFRFVSPGIAGMPGIAQVGQAIGRVLATGDFDDNGHADLVLGAPWHDVVDIGAEVGAEVVFYGSLFADGFAGNSTFAWSAAVP